MLITQHGFTDFEDFSETLGEYNFESHQLGRGKFSATTLQVNTGKALLTHLTTNLALEVEGSPPRNMVTVGVPTARCRPFVWRHRHSNANTLQFYRPDSELCVNSLGEFDAIDISFTEAHLQKVAEKLELTPVYTQLKHGSIVEINDDDLTELRQLTQRLAGLALTRNPRQIDSRLVHALEFTLPGTLLRIMQKRTTDGFGGRRTQDSLEAFKRAKLYIHNSDHEANIVTVSDLCNLTGMSDRTLQKVFVTQCGMTPKAYIRSVRLNRAHRAFLESYPATTKVADIANSLGFWHIGQFAADYRRLFSELPSETLARTKL
jgi:AraC family transcriptional regulator, ethanolamine operon transcriptional activator